MKDWRCARLLMPSQTARATCRSRSSAGELAWKWDDGVPVYVLAQVQWEMFVTGLAITDVVACIGGTDYQEFQVLRDDAASRT